MKLKHILAAGVAFAMSAGAASAASVLIFGDRMSAQNEVQAVLEANGDTVTNVDRSFVPADLSVYDTIWSLSWDSSFSVALEDSLIAYVANGGGLYLTFERPCCEPLNDSVERIIDASLLAGDVTVGGFGDVGGTFSYNPNAIGNMDADLASGWVPSAPGQIDGVSGNNVIVSSDITGRAVAAGWNESDLGAGRIAAFGDIDWLNSVSAEEAQVIRNTQEFLYDGYVGPNPNVVPLPAGVFLMLGGLGGLATLRRRKKA